MQSTTQSNIMYSPVPDQYADMVSSADAVMDELFGAVEQSLHIQKVPRPPQPQNGTPGDLDLDKLGLDDLDILWLSPYGTQPNPNGGENFCVPPVQTPPAPTAPAGNKQNWLTPVLLLCACGSAMLAVVLWSLHLSQKLQQLSAVTSASPITPVTPGNAINNSILTPDTESAFSRQIRELLAINSTPNLPPLAPATPANPITSPVTSASPLPNSPVMALPAPPLSNTPLPVPQALPQTVFVPVYQSPNALPPAPINAPTPNTATPNAPTAALPPGETPAPANPTFTLVGVLSLGDRSTAMFELDGSVQSITQGNLVGNTGWTLDRVQQRDVVLRRGQETRTVVVGQKF